MTTITAEQVRRLSARTQEGLANCKRALEECRGDEEKAVRWLRYRGIPTSGKRFWELVNRDEPAGERQ